MTLVAKSNHGTVLKSNEKGQISLFFSASLVVLISIIAFVINVGLFVKAKINLQNATDAAAFAGASVQARQLTKIAHLNWEMRNIYKEWLYKYYVLGNLNIDDVMNVTPGSSGTMKFIMQNDVDALSGFTRTDIFNFPAVCLKLSVETQNLCRRFAIPGLPEWGSSNLPGAEQQSRDFQDQLIGSKVQDCIRRTRLNMQTTAMWTYNVLTTQNVFSEEAPEILSNRPGAFPQALELAMRIRNLEKITNREPLEKVCSQQGASTKIQCQHSIDQISREPKANERIVKAFYSGYRNLGGNSDDDEMKASFTLTELAPNVLINTSPTDPSNLLIPSPYYQKPFLDLKLMSVNYALFYAAMIPRAENDSSGACDISKSAIPVPGYPLGFYKNPAYLTYYAVKGEAEFIGMFNPFGGETVVMTAFAAAKPIGGRIGPMLFTDKTTGSDIVTVARPGPRKRSVPYVLTYDLVGAQILMPDVGTKTYQPTDAKLGDFGPGVALPVNGKSDDEKFWLTDPSQPIGGKITQSSGVQFGIPNLVYDYQTPFMGTGYAGVQTDALHVVKLSNSSTGAEIGLYSKSQFGMFKGTSLGSGGDVSIDQIVDEIHRVRAPTSYEAANYLIPVPYEVANSQSPSLGHFGQITGQAKQSPNGINVYSSYLYAPLYGTIPDDLLYRQDTLFSTIKEYLLTQESGIKKYMIAMNVAADAINKQSQMLNLSAQGAQMGFKAAGEGVSDINLPPPGIDFDKNQVPKTCDSILGNFLNFYYGGDVGIPTGLLNGQSPPTDGTRPCSKSLGDQLKEFYTTNAGSSYYSPSHYYMELSWNPASGLKMNSTLSAYVPGPFTGSSIEGIFSNFTGSAGQNLRRNFYSAKLVSLRSLTSGGIYDDSNTFPNMAEGDIQANTDITQQQGTNFKNPLQIPSEASDITH